MRFSDIEVLQDHSLTLLIARKSAQYDGSRSFRSTSPVAHGRSKCVHTVEEDPEVIQKVAKTLFGRLVSSEATIMWKMNVLIPYLPFFVPQFSLQEEAGPNVLLVESDDHSKLSRPISTQYRLEHAVELRDLSQRVTCLNERVVILTCVWLQSLCIDQSLFQQFHHRDSANASNVLYRPLRNGSQWYSYRMEWRKQGKVKYSFETICWIFLVDMDHEAVRMKLPGMCVGRMPSKPTFAVEFSTELIMNTWYLTLAHCPLAERPSFDPGEECVSEEAEYDFRMKELIAYLTPRLEVLQPECVGTWVFDLDRVEVARFIPFKRSRSECVFD